MTLLQRWKQTALHNKALVLTGILVAFGTLFYAAAAAFQVWLMKESSIQAAKQADRLVSAANQSIREAVKNSDQSLRAALQQNREALDSAISQSKTSLDASVAQSKASLDASIEASRRDQRAWLNIVDIRLTEEPGVGKRIPLLFSIQNTGRTPAVEVISKAHYGFGPAEPSAPNWDTITSIPPHRFIVFAGTVNRDIQVGSQKDADIFMQGTIDAYTAPQTTYALYLIVRVEYDDVFGCQHWSQTCLLHKFGAPLNSFQQCASNNEVDRRNSVCQAIPSGQQRSGRK